MRKGAIGILAAFAAGCLIPVSVNAMPFFARKYNQNCNLCHTQIPELNAVGEAFFENGFQLPADLESSAQKMELDPTMALDAAAPWGILIKDYAFTWEKQDTNDAVIGFGLPDEVEWQTVTRFSPYASGYAAFAYEDKEFGAEDIFLSLHMPTEENARTLGSIRLGQFSPTNFTPGPHRRLTRQKVAVYGVDNLGVKLRKHGFPGIELYGSPSEKVFVQAGTYVEGNGFTLGDYNARLKVRPVPNVAIGGFAYLGKTEVAIDTVTIDTSSSTTFGGEADAFFGPAHFTAAVSVGSNTIAGTDDSYMGAYVEGSAFVVPDRLVAGLRVNWINPKDSTSAFTEVQNVLPFVSLMVTRNFTAEVEFQYDMTKAKDQQFNFVLYSAY